MAGTVQLNLDTPANQRHRADLAKLLVHPDFRRAGTGRALMQRAEQAARGIGRTLLTLDTVAGDAGEALYRGLGWQEAGRIPGYAADARGALHDTVLFYKAM
jgi:GNAT superfamily N-acetyltransferase